MMTDSEEVGAAAAQIVARILALTDDMVVAQILDAPIDCAVKSFRFCWGSAFSPKRFHRVLGRLLAHIHRHLARKGHVFCADRARDEAIALVEAVYTGEHEPGYDGALLDIAFPPEGTGEGVDAVLLKFVEFLKGMMRQRYLDWVYARCIPPLDHELRRAIAEHVLERFSDLLPQELRARPAFEWDHSLRDLFEAIQEIQAVLERPL